VKEHAGPVADDYAADRELAKVIAHAVTSGTRVAVPHKYSRVSRRGHNIVGAKKGEVRNPLGINGKNKPGRKPKSKKVRMGRLVSQELKRRLTEDERLAQDIVSTLLDIARDPTHPLVLQATRMIVDRTEPKSAADDAMRIARIEVIGASAEEMLRINEFKQEPVLIQHEEVKPSGSRE